MIQSYFLWFSNFIISLLLGLDIIGWFFFQLGMWYFVLIWLFFVIFQISKWNFVFRGRILTGLLNRFYMLSNLLICWADLDTSKLEKCGSSMPCYFPMRLLLKTLFPSYIAALQNSGVFLLLSLCILTKHLPSQISLLSTFEFCIIWSNIYNIYIKYIGDLVGFINR